MFGLSCASFTDSGLAFHIHESQLQLPWKVCHSDSTMYRVAWHSSEKGDLKFFAIADKCLISDLY